MKFARIAVVLMMAAALTACPQKPSGTPTASFTLTPDAGTNPLVVHFTDTSLPGDDAITAWAWDFGDSGTDSTSTEQNPVHTYTVNGVYDVMLTVTNSKGSDSTLSTAAVVVGNVWAATSGFAGDDKAVSIVEASGDVLVLATVTQAGANNTDMQLERRNASGQLVWRQFYGGDLDETAGAVVYDNGDIYICGSTKSFGIGGFDAYVLKLDNLGNVVWTKTYGTIGTDTAEKMVATTDGIVIAGMTNAVGKANEFYLFKIDSDGTQLWSKTYGGPGNEAAHGLRAATDGGFIVCGSQVNTSKDMFVVRTDSTGTQMWTASAGSTSGDDTAYDGYQVGDNYYIFGTGYSDTITAYDVMMLTLDKDGKVVKKSYVGSVNGESGYAAVQSGSNFTVVGSTSTSTDGKQAYIVNIKPDGTKNWSRVLGGTGDETAYTITTVGSDIAIAGTTTSWGAGGADTYILRLTSLAYGPEIPNPAL